MERESSIDRILRVIDSIPPQDRTFADQQAAIEAAVWADLYDSYEHGWIDTIEEAEEKFRIWRTVYGVGKSAVESSQHLPQAS